MTKTRQRNSSRSKKQCARRMRKKQTFLRQKDVVLSQINRRIKERFRQVGFAKWGKGQFAIYKPAMFLGPYDVPPGPLRNQCIKNMKKVRLTENSSSGVYNLWK